MGQTAGGLVGVAAMARMPGMAGMPRVAKIPGRPGVAVAHVTAMPMSAGTPVMPKAEESHDCEPGYSERKTKPIGAHIRG